jgi:SnoaL-like domain
MTATDTPTNLDAIVENYFAMWNATDANERKKLIEANWTPDARYLDSMFSAEGAAGLSETVATVHEHYPGYRFRQVGGVDGHHDRARWAWEFVGPDGGTPAAVGVDFALISTDGQLREVTGFFETAA